jgi:hypothetical protein
VRDTDRPEGSEPESAWPDLPASDTDGGEPESVWPPAGTAEGGEPDSVWPAAAGAGAGDAASGPQSVQPDVPAAGGAGSAGDAVAADSDPARDAATMTLDLTANGEAARPPRPAAGPGRALGAGPGFRARLAAASASAASALSLVARNWRGIRPSRRAAAGAAGAAAGPRPGEAAGLALARLTALPAVLMVAWLIPGLPLLLGGSFLPFPMLLISVPLAAALTVNGLREIPSAWPRLRSRAGNQDPGWTTWFGLLGTVAVVVGLAAWQLRESSESLIVLRDPGTYLQAGYWIAQHGTLPIPEQLKAFGGAHPGLSFASVGFLARGTSIFPAVTPGMPILLAAGAWAHGLTGAMAVGPILGGLAALSFAGLVGRLVGAQWAPAGALLLGLSLPQQYISRSTLSETALQVLLFGGLCMLADSLSIRPASFAPPGSPAAPALSPAPAGVGATARPAWWRRIALTAEWVTWLTPARALAALAGVALGLGLLISLDGATYLLPVIPFGAILLVGRRPQAVPFLVGFVVGAIYGLAGAFLLDRPFVDSVGPTLAVAGIVAVWLVALSVVGGQLSRFRSVQRVVPRLLAKIPLRWLPELGALITAAALIGFAVRPYVQTVRGHPSAALAHFIASLQRLQGLPVDPDRLYSEQTLYWVIWYIGLPTVLLGGFGLVLLVRRCLRGLLTWRDPDGRWRNWGLPVAIICAGSATVLWAPDIVPDQPWASRRLVVMVLPGLIICALWAASWLAVRARSRGAKPGTTAVVGLFCTAAMLVPIVSTTFGVGLSHGGKSGGLQPVAQGMALERTGTGQVQAVSTLCAQIPRKASVVIVDGITAARFAQVIRGECGVPVASMAGQPDSAVSTVLTAISAAGRRPVVLAARAARLAAFGGSPVRVLDLSTTEDPHQLTQLPTAPAPIHYVIWMTAPAGSGVGT